jgi:hypothetical protein
VIEKMNLRHCAHLKIQFHLITDTLKFKN